MKIPLQEKIAELERRIVALEAQPRRVETTTTVGVPVTENPHWRAMWREFDALLKSIFPKTRGGA